VAPLLSAAMDGAPSSADPPTSADGHKPSFPQAMLSSGVSVSSMTSNPMLNAKIMRRKVQQDTELLSNRIERLKAEERKAKAKVAETRLKGREILSLQKRNEQANAARALAKRMEDEQRQREAQKLQLRKAEHRAAMKMTFESMYTSKREDVQLERMIKKENAEVLRQTRLSELDRAQKGRSVIRSQQAQVRARFEQQRQAHQEYLAQDFIGMIAMEDKRREEIEKEIAVMEIEERQHIERLKALQDEQKSAYDALEQALGS